MLHFIQWLDTVYPDMPQWERDFAIENHRRFVVKQIRFHDLNYFPAPPPEPEPLVGHYRLPFIIPTPISKALKTKTPTKKKKEIGIEL